MREIKFRAYWHDQGKMDDNPYGDEFISEGTPVNGLFKGWPFGDGTATLMQYTGLKDKNGKEIYEGDIVKLHNEYDNSTTHSIKYYAEDSDYPAFDLDPVLEAEVNGLSWAVCASQYEIEVVGNIYENEELLDEAH